MIRRAIVTVGFLLVSVLSARADDGSRWPQFRGPGGAGVAAESMKLPTDFGPDKHVLWKAKTPPGHSSPCVWDNRIFLTGYDKEKKQLATLCLDRHKGQILWSRPAPAERIEKVHPVSSPATGTAVADGKRVYVYFGSYGLLCYDFDGNEVWKHPLPTPRTRFGTGTSPVLAGGVLLLNCGGDNFEGYLLAVAAATGKQLWRIDKPKCSPGYSPPLVLGTGEASQIIVHGALGVSCFDLKDGQEHWSVLGTMASAIPMPVAGDELIFTVAQLPGGDLDDRWKLPKFDELLEKYDKDKDGRLSRQEIPKDLVLYSRGGAHSIGDITLQSMLGYIDTDRDGYVTRFEWFKINAMAAIMHNTLSAVRPDAAGKKAETAWKEKASLPEVPSPLFYRGRLYLIRNGGIASCWDAKAGKPLYQERVGATGHYYASPVAGDGKVYVCSATGVVSVLQAGDKLEVLAKNDFAEPIMATPALVDGKIYVRTEEHLYAFGK